MKKTHKADLSNLKLNINKQKHLRKLLYVGEKNSSVSVLKKPHIHITMRPLTFSFSSVYIDIYKCYHAPTGFGLIKFLRMAFELSLST